MKKLTTTLWVIIISCSIFLGLNYIKSEKLTSEEDISATLPKTDLRTEVETEISDRTYSENIKAGNVYFNKGYLDEAIEKYKQSLNIAPDSKEALYKLGTALIAANKPKEAIRYLEQLKKIDNEIYVNILIGKAYLNDRDIENAKKTFFSIDPENQNKEVRYYKTIINLLYKNHKIAEEEFGNIDTGNSKIIKKAYEEFSINKDGKEQHLEVLLAKALTDVEEYGAAIPLLYDAIKLQNNYRSAWIILGYCYLKTDKPLDAIDALTNAKNLEPEKPETLYYLGIAHSITNEFDTAITYMQSSLEKGFEPKSEINKRLADLYLLQKSYNKALESYTKIIDLGLNDMNIYTKAIWLCIEKLNKPQKAIGLAEQSVKNNPENATAYNLLGWAFASYGDYEKAKDSLIKALGLNPHLASAYLNLGWMYEKKSMPHIAKEYYKKAYEEGKGNPIEKIAKNRYLQANITSP